MTGNHFKVPAKVQKPFPVSEIVGAMYVIAIIVTLIKIWL